ncbi:MAG: ABC transporter ATP-binding protein [Oscillatoriaceae bacterium SKW80]|nr:ABC transporter ATP-binding protein [Oscillatoriaceae bacterium SKYG93]MCX8120974.1 ABC transporter ATP-binding protein [Oscillatoriaceae bacterium SKW80]MDW8452247.1 ABC transporter ATP-binding protein [Oscillatoriaceae cyanobacterium SKYGB_i_bin93]HIK26582.1 ABC transporter ATP-binding protein [Oscillatoriaceae cyanobacterium M7585_C2015_266]
MFQTATHNQGTTANDVTFDVELRKVFKVFNGETAVRGLDLEIRRGEFFSILGPSGCGKTTTLRMIAGFDTPSAGEVTILGQLMTHIPPYRRPVNTVFQSYALFNHLTVWDNIAFGLRIKRLGKAEIEERVREVIKLVKMEKFASRYPAQLSGGQQQRVALARALVNRPAVLLLDEPLGALDLKLRKEMQVELSNLHQDVGLTFIMVTHDQEEALSMSDRIGVMNEGRIDQIGTPSQIYERPQTAFVARFIGDINQFKGRVENHDNYSLLVVTENKLKIVVQSSESLSHISKGDSVTVNVRPEKIQLSLYPPSISVNCFEGRLKQAMYKGTHIQYMVTLISGDTITVTQPNTVGNAPDPHTPIYAFWEPSNCLALTA